MEKHQASEDWNPHTEDFNHLVKYCVQPRHQSLRLLKTLPVTSFYS